MSRLLKGCHPQTQVPFHANPRPVVLDTSVAARPARRRVNGKQVADSDLSVCTSAAGRPDFDAIDTVVDMCGFIADLESRGAESPRSASLGQLSPSAFMDGI